MLTPSAMLLYASVLHSAAASVSLRLGSHIGAGCDTCCTQNDCRGVYTNCTPGVCCGTHGSNTESACCPWGASCISCQHSWRCLHSSTISFEDRCTTCEGDVPEECSQRAGWSRQWLDDLWWEGGYDLVILLLFLSALVIVAARRRRVIVIRHHTSSSTSPRLPQATVSGTPVQNERVIQAPGAKAML